MLVKNKITKNLSLGNAMLVSPWTLQGTQLLRTPLVGTMVHTALLGLIRVQVPEMHSCFIITHAAYLLSLSPPFKQYKSTLCQNLPPPSRGKFS